MTIAAGREELRTAVAGILLPVLESASGFDRVVEVLELRLTSEHDSIQRCQTLRTIAEVQETKLANPRGALDSLLRAVTERPEEPTVHAEVERLAEEVHDWRRVRDVLSERAQATFDPELACELYSRLGRIAESKLDDPKIAEQAFSSAVAQAGDRPELLEALDRLYVRLGNWRSLADILERRTTAVPDTSQQPNSSIACRIQLEQFDEPVRSLASIRQVLDRVPDDAAAIALLEGFTEQHDLFEETAEILESVYRASRQPERLVACLASEWLWRPIRVRGSNTVVRWLKFSKTNARTRCAPSMCWWTPCRKIRATWPCSTEWNGSRISPRTTQGRPTPWKRPCNCDLPLPPRWLETYGCGSQRGNEIELWMQPPQSARSCTRLSGIPTTTRF